MHDIKNTIVNLTKNVTKTSGDLFKTTKLNLSLASEESNLKNLYTEIGKKVHEIYQYGGSLGKFFDEKYREIEDCERKISEIREQIGSIKGVRICMKCGKTIDRAAGFCPKCGVKVDDGRHDLGTHSSDVQMHEGYVVQQTGEPYVSVPLPPEPLPQSDVPSEYPHSPSATTAPAPEPQPINKTCRVCTAANEPGVKFCISCGRLLD